MIRATGAAVIVRRRQCWKCGWTIVAAVLFLTAAVRLQAGGVRAQKVAPNAPGVDSPLPPRALLRIGSELLTTQSPISGVAFSPDGRMVAAGTANTAVPQVAFFDVQTGRQVKAIRPPDRSAGSVQTVAFSPDGSKLLWGESDGSVALWDLTQDRLLFREKLHDYAVDEVQFSPDGSAMASADEYRAVEIRRVEKPLVIVRRFVAGEEQSVPSGNPAPPPGKFPAGPVHLALTPDGKRLVVGSRASISIWRIEDGALLRQIDHAHGIHEGSSLPGFHSLAVTADGRRILSAGGSRVPIRQNTLEHGPNHVRYSEVRLWDAETGLLIKNFHRQEDHGFGYAALSPDGKHIAVGDLEVLRILSAESSELEREFTLPGCRGNPLAFSPDSSVVAMPILNSLALFDVRTGRRLHHFEDTSDAMLIAASWSPSGDRIVTGHGDGGVRVWAATTGKLIWQKLFSPDVTHSGWSAYPLFVTYSGESHTVIVAGRRDDPTGKHSGGMAVYDAQSGRTVRELDLPAFHRAVVTPDSRIAILATSPGRGTTTALVGVEIGTGKTRWTDAAVNHRRTQSRIQAMQFRANSPFFVAALRDGNVVSLNGLTGREQRQFVADWRTPRQQQRKLPPLPQFVEGAFSADGRILVASVLDTTNDQWVYRWDVETGELKRKTRYPHRTGSHTFSPNGNTLATNDFLSAADRGRDLIRLYDVESDEEVLAIDPGDNRVSVLLFSPDGTKLLSGFLRGSAIVWDIRRGKTWPPEK